MTILNSIVANKLDIATAMKIENLSLMFEEVWLQTYENGVKLGMILLIAKNQGERAYKDFLQEIDYTENDDFVKSAIIHAEEYLADRDV